MLSENALRCQFQLGKSILKLRLSSLSPELAQVKWAKFQVSKQILLHPLTERVLCVQQALDTVTDGKSSSCYNHPEPQRTSHPIIQTGQWEVDTGSKKAEWNKETSRGLSQRSSGWGKDNNTHVFPRLCIPQYVQKACQLINPLSQKAEIDRGKHLLTMPPWFCLNKLLKNHCSIWNLLRYHGKHDICLRRQFPRRVFGKSSGMIQTM